MDISQLRHSVHLFNRVGFQFSVLLVVFSTVVVLALGAHTYILLDVSLLKADEMPVTLAQRAAGAVQQRLIDIRQDVLLVGGSLDATLTPDELEHTLLRSHPDILGIALYDTEGVLRWGWERERRFEHTYESVLLEPFYVTARRGGTYRGLPFPLDDTPVYEWAEPVRASEESEVLGVMLLIVDLTPIAETLADAQYTAFLVDQTGNIMLTHTGLPGEGVQTGTHPILSVYRDRLDGVKSYQSADGTRMLGAWSTLAPSPWGIVVEMSMRSVFEEFYLSLALLGVLFVALFILVAYIALFFYREVSAPITQIQRAILSFADGDLRARIETKKKNELGMLAQTFNMLAGRIADEPNRLRDEVDRRTEELRAANTKLQKLVREVQENAKAVLEKEKQLVEANESLAALNNELERVGEVLRKRDTELTEANARLEEIDSTKSEFVSVAAHQLRTPLTGIRWSLKSLVNNEYGELNDEQLSTIKNGLTAVKAAINLINDLLDIARIEEGRYGFHFTVAPLAPVLDIVLDRQLQRAEKKGVVLTSKQFDRSVCLKHDPERLAIAIENAVDNAIKYTPPKGEVELSARVGDNSVEVSVTDTGIGIPKEQQHRLFTKFFRAPNAMLMQTAGTGLGLYLMKNIVERHEGVVEVESKEGKGTTVTFVFPIVPCDTDAEEPDKNSAKIIRKQRERGRDEDEML